MFLHAAVVLAFFAAVDLRAGEPLGASAARVAAAARRAGAVRVAVFPLEARETGQGRSGEALADALVARLLADGRVKVVERTRLPDLMEERRLGAAGATAAVPDAKLAPADAVVTGSFSRAGRRVVSSVRLVRASDGEILAAAREEFDWDAPGGDPDESWTLVVPPPAFTVEVPKIVDEPTDLRDAPNDGSCADAAERVDRIVAGVLELKARYWASELRKGFSPYAVTRNPGSEIADPALKARFYAALKSWFDRPYAPELSRAEFERMRAEDARAAALADRCGS